MMKELDRLAYVNKETVPRCGNIMNSKTEERGHSSMVELGAHCQVGKL